jgi:hypothetical protein
MFHCGDATLRAQKRCGSEPPLTTPQSRAYITSNLTIACGRPLGVNPHPDPKEDSANEKGSVAETSAQSINGKIGSYGRGDRTISPRYLQAYAALNLCLIGGNTHSLTEGCTN